MEVERAANRPCLHELSSLPKGVAHVLLGHPFDPRAERELGCSHHLRMDSAGCSHDVDEALGLRAVRQEMAGEPPGTNVVPGDRDDVSGGYPPAAAYWAAPASASAACAAARRASGTRYGEHDT